MAKGSPLMGTQRGKLGESVLYRKQGEQFERAYIRHPANPQSGAQQLQRMIVASCNAAYSGMKEICDHSFEGVATGVRSFGYFMQQNIAAYRASVSYVVGQISFGEDWSFVTPKTNNIPTSPFIVARGSLNPVPFVPFYKSDLGYDSIPTNLEACQLVYFPFETSRGEMPHDDFTLGDSLSLAGFRVGDMLTWVGIIRLPNMIGIMDEQRFAFARFTVVETLHDTPLLSLVCTKTSHAPGLPAIDKYNVIEQGYWRIFSTDGGITFAGLNMQKVIGFSSKAAIAMGGWIHSRPLGNGRFLRSNCELSRNLIAKEIHASSWVWENVAGDDAYPLYMNIRDTKGDSLYLLNGGSE